MKLALVEMQLPHVERKEGARLAREPIGLLELGAFVREKAGAEIDYIVVNDENFNAATILQNEPEVVGFSTYSYNYHTAIQLAQRIKETDKNIRIVFGGPHAGMVPEAVYEQNKGTIEGCVAGEGELGILDFLDGKTGVIRRESIPLNQIPRADRLESLLDNANFRVLGYENHKTAVVLASRGCTRKCDFCITRLTGYRAKTQGSVIDEIKALVSEHNVEVIIFDDPLLNGNLHYLESLADRLISEHEISTLGRNVYFIGMCDFNFGRGYKKILEKMAKAGFIQINWGIEDPRQEYRKGLNKNSRIQAEVLRAARDCGIYNRGLLMLPTNLNASNPETDIKSYVESLAHLEIDEVKVNVTTPFPGTPLYDRLALSGKITNKDWGKYDTHHLVFQAGNWTQEVIDWGRRYIVTTFDEMRKR